MQFATNVVCTFGTVARLDFRMGYSGFWEFCSLNLEGSLFFSFPFSKFLFLVSVFRVRLRVRVKIVVRFKF